MFRIMVWPAKAIDCKEIVKLPNETSFGQFLLNQDAGSSLLVYKSSNFGMSWVKLGWIDMCSDQEEDFFNTSNKKLRKEREARQATTRHVLIRQGKRVQTSQVLDANTNAEIPGVFGYELRMRVDEPTTAKLFMYLINDEGQFTEDMSGQLIPVEEHVLVDEIEQVPEPMEV